MDIDEIDGLVERLGGRNPPAGAGSDPRGSHEREEDSTMTGALLVEPDQDERTDEHKGEG